MEENPAEIELHLPPDLVRRIDAWRRAQPATPSRAEAVRRLIELGLQTAPAHPQEPEPRLVAPEDEVRSGPEAAERPIVELDD